MKKILLLSTLVALSATVVAGRLEPSRAPVTAPIVAPTVAEDPPPEPLDCPFCSGNAALHIKRTFAIEKLVAEITALALSW